MSNLSLRSKLVGRLTIATDTARAISSVPSVEARSSTPLNDNLPSNPYSIAKISQSPNMRWKGTYLLLPLLTLVVTPVYSVPMDTDAYRVVLEADTLDETSTNLAIRQAERYVFTCTGSPGTSPTGDGGCGGPCTMQTVRSATINSCSAPPELYVPNTNCIDTDGSTPFVVCDGDNSCNPQTSFHPTTDSEGRSIYNTRGTMYLYFTSC